MSQTIEENLDNAIAAKSQLTLIPLNVESRATEMAKLLSVDDDGIWVQPAKPNGVTVRKLIDEQVQLLGQFFDRDARYSFLTRILRRKQDYWLTDTVAIEAWLLEPPGTVDTLQERILPRFRVTENKKALHAKVTILQAPAPIRTGDAPGAMVDLSVGGIGIVCPSQLAILRSAPRTILYQAGIQFGIQKIMLKGYMVQARPVSAQSMRIGIEFLPSSEQAPTAIADLEALLTKLDPDTVWRPQH